ncbi:MAG: hypothetical protein R3F51_13335 [Cyanobacteriota/Melainabacteria group bacterium]
MSTPHCSKICVEQFHTLLDPVVIVDAETGLMAENEFPGGFCRT